MAEKYLKYLFLKSFSSNPRPFLWGTPSGVCLLVERPFMYCGSSEIRRWWFHAPGFNRPPPTAAGSTSSTQTKRKAKSGGNWCSFPSLISSLKRCNDNCQQDGTVLRRRLLLFLNTAPAPVAVDWKRRRRRAQLTHCSLRSTYFTALSPPRPRLLFLALFGQPRCSNGNGLGSSWAFMGYDVTATRVTESLYQSNVALHTLPPETTFLFPNDNAPPPVGQVRYLWDHPRAGGYSFDSLCF